MANVGTLSIKFTGDARDLEKTFTTIGVKANLFASAIEGGFKTAVRAGADFLSTAVGIARENENTLTSFKNLTGSIGEAKTLYKDLIEFSSKTPFSSKEIQSGATTLLGFGLTARDATAAIKDLGAAAAANADTDLKRLIVSYGQIQGANVAMTKDLREFVNNGIPIYQILADTLDVSVSKINEMASAGKLTGDVITRAFRESASEGGRFANTLIDQSNTLDGLTSTMKDNYAITLGQIANNLLPAFKEAAKGVNNVLLEMQKYFESAEGQEWATKLAAGIRAAFQTIGGEFELIKAKAELLTAGVFEVLLLGSAKADEKLAAAEKKVRDLEATTTRFGEAFQDAIRDIEFDNALSGLSEMVDGFDQSAKKVSGSPDSISGGLKEVKKDIDIITDAQKLQLAVIENIKNEYQAFRDSLLSSDIPISSDNAAGKAKVDEFGAPIDTNDFSFGNVEEITAQTLAIDKQAEARNKLNESINQAGQVAAIFSAKLKEAQAAGATGFRAYASAAVESSKEVIAAQIREGVVIAATKALANVPFPANIILAGIAGGAAEALFRSLVSKIKIPAFGDGGVVFGPTLALIGEKGPEAIVPLGRNMNGGSQQVQITGVQYGADTYWQNANSGIIGRLIYGG